MHYYFRLHFLWSFREKLYSPLHTSSTGPWLPSCLIRALTKSCLVRSQLTLIYGFLVPYVHACKAPCQRHIWREIWKMHLCWLSVWEKWLVSLWSWFRRDPYFLRCRILRDWVSIYTQWECSKPRWNESSLHRWGPREWGRDKPNFSQHILRCPSNRRKECGWIKHLKWRG